MKIIHLWPLCAAALLLMGCEPKQESEVKNPIVGQWIKSAHSPSNPHAALTPDQLIKVALQHDMEGRPNEALGTLTEALEKFPDHATVLAIRSQIYSNTQRYAEALNDLEKAVEGDATNAEFRINRAQLYRKFGRYDEARLDLDTAIELDDEQVAAYFNRGALRYSEQDFDGAVADFDLCIALDPHAPAPYFNRANAWQALGDLEKAIADIDRFLQINGNAQWTDVAQELKSEWTRTEQAG